VFFSAEEIKTTNDMQTKDQFEDILMMREEAVEEAGELGT